LRAHKGALLQATLLALAVALVLGVTRPAHAQERVVRVWHAYGGSEEAALRETASAFHRAQPDLRIELLAVAFGAYASKLEAAIPTGHGPDVFLDAHERLVTYDNAGLLEPYGPLPPELRAEFDAPHLEALSLRGRLYALPLSIKCAALFVNDALVPRDPQTLEEIEAMRARLPPGTFPLALEAENAYFDSALLHAYGGTLLDRAGRYAFFGPAVERTLGHLKRLTREAIVPEETSAALVRQLFASGRAATAVNGPWLAPDLPRTLRWHVAPLPRVRAAGDRAMRPFSTIEGAMIARNTRERDAARRFVAFLAGPEGARIRALRGGQIVASRRAWSDPRVAQNSLLATFRTAGQQAIPMPTHPHMRYAFEPAEKALRKVMRGDMPIRAALAEGAHRFDDMTRPPPPARSPSLALIAIGVALLGFTIAAARSARDPLFRLEVRKSLPAYRYVVHAALIVFVLVVLPLLVGAAASFFAGRGTDMHYVGLANYVDILTARGGDLLGHGSFWLVLLVTVAWTVANLAIHLALGIALALVLHRPTLKLRGVYRVLLILPWAVPTYVTALAWKGLFHRQFGAVNALLELVGVDPVSWFASWATAFTANLTTNVWLGFPFMMVVTLGALAAIPKDLYEAAAVDGASAWQRFKLVTLPMLAPSLAPAVAMGAMWTFNMFNVVFLVSGGEPDGSTEILISEAYRWAFTRSQQYGYAAAYAVLIFLLLVAGTRLVERRLESARRAMA